MIRGRSGALILFRRYLLPLSGRFSDSRLILFVVVGLVDCRTTLWSLKSLILGLRILHRMISGRSRGSFYQALLFDQLFPLLLRILPAHLYSLSPRLRRHSLSIQNLETLLFLSTCCSSGSRSLVLLATSFLLFTIPTAFFRLLVLLLPR